MDETTAREYGVPEDKITSIALLSKRLEGIADEGMLTDPTTLLRFLIAREGVVDDAEMMVRDSLKWREEFGLNGLMDEWGVTGEDGVWNMEAQSGRAQLACRHFYGCRLDNKARDGSPIILQRIGKADFDGMARGKMESLMTSSFLVMLEDAFRFGRLESLRQKRLVRAAFVIDAKGLGTAILRHVSMIKASSALGKTYFAEITRTITVVNAPWIFSTVWSMISPILPKASRAKVQILGSKFDSTLEAHGNLDVKILPAYLGGSGPADVCPTYPVPEDAGTGLDLSCG